MFSRVNDDAVKAAERDAHGDVCVHVADDDVVVVAYNVFSPSSVLVEGHSAPEDVIQFLLVYVLESDGVMPLLFSAVPYVLQLSSNGFDMAV